MTSDSSDARAREKGKPKRLTPWQKIMRADKRSTGLRLSVEEVGRLAADGAIEARAGHDDDESEETSK